jgi:hypothetical protein
MADWVLCQAPGFNRNMPERFWAPPPDMLERVEPPAWVTLRAVEVDQDGGGQIWDGEGTHRPGDCRGHL